MVGMGGQHSTLPKGRRKSLRSFRKSISHQTNLSHTFTVNDSNDKLELMNINIATEEELMTLSGITRQVAKSIVEHRKMIGRFRKVEDLALVVGADRMEQIRPEICVSTRKSHSCQSSRAQSYDSLKSNDSSRATLRNNRLVNINKATVFELQAINGITQEIAAAIVHYRTKRGDFKHVDDLIKVKSIDRLRLANITRFLTVENDNDSDVNRPHILTNGYTMPSYNRNSSNSDTVIYSVTNGLPTSTAMDIFELLSTYSPRPIVDEVFKFTRNNEPAIRVATWNLNCFSMDKVQNLGVREVICRTILENGCVNLLIDHKYLDR